MKIGLTWWALGLHEGGTTLWEPQLWKKNVEKHYSSPSLKKYFLCKLTYQFHHTLPCLNTTCNLVVCLNPCGVECNSDLALTTWSWCRPHKLKVTVSNTTAGSSETSCASGVFRSLVPTGYKFVNSFHLHRFNNLLEWLTELKKAL